MGEKYYSLGNAIAGFGVAQSVALIIATISSDTLQKLFKCDPVGGSLLVFASGVILYGGLVGICWCMEKKARGIKTNWVGNWNPYQTLFWGRFLAIVLFYILSARVASLRYPGITCSSIGA